MKWFEVTLVLISLAAAGLVIFGWRNRRFDAGLFTLLTLSLVVHAAMGLFRFQVIPLYAVGAALIIVLLLRLVRRKPKAHRRLLAGRIALSIVVVALTASAIYLDRLLPVFTVPEPTGSYAIGTVVRHLTDETREETLGDEPGGKRELMVNVWYPVDPAAAKGKPREHYPEELGEAVSLVFDIPKQLFGYLTTIPTHVVPEVELAPNEAGYPVLLFSPGIRSTRFQSMTAIEELVSRGYIVVGMDHPYTSAKVAFPDERSTYYKPDPEFPTSQALYDHNVKGVGIRAADARFVLDTLTAWNAQGTGGLFEGKLDLDRVGIFGHSYGGATTAEALALDHRFKAGVSLEGGFWGSVAHNGLQQPFMYMMTGGTAKSLDTSETNKDKVFFEEFATDLDFVMKHSSSDRYYLTVDKLFHQSFTEIPLLSPALFAKDIDPFHNIDITRSYVAAFFDYYLKGEKQPLLDGPSPEFPEVEYDENYTKRDIWLYNR
ncbi:lipase [Paenibacillaceae bacterium]|nr:lipase [Paenibacillaceae bacterium]